MNAIGGAPTATKNASPPSTEGQVSAIVPITNSQAMITTCIATSAHVVGKGVARYHPDDPFAPRSA